MGLSSLVSTLLEFFSSGGYSYYRFKKIMTALILLLFTSSSLFVVNLLVLLLILLVLQHDALTKSLFTSFFSEPIVTLTPEFCSDSFLVDGFVVLGHHDEFHHIGIVIFDTDEFELFDRVHTIFNCNNCGCSLVYNSLSDL